MGREVRRVPANWQHPTDDEGRFIPLFDGFNDRAAEWDAGAAKWTEGLVDDYHGGWKPKSADQTYPYEEWAGERPDPKDYMPDWPEAERTHYQMYESTTEGTPISPVMATPEELARWLADNGASFFGGQTTTYDHWLGIVKGTDVGLPVFVVRGDAP